MHKKRDERGAVASSKPAAAERNSMPWVITRYLREVTDQSIRTVAGNAGLAFVGITIGSVLNLAAMALTARALGVTAFGWFVVVRTYALLVDKVVNFQSWQALIRYGAELLHSGDEGGFQRLVKLCFYMDVSTAAIGCALGAAGIVTWGRYQAWPPDLVVAALVGVMAVGLNWIGTPIGVLRLFNRFGPIAMHQALVGLLQTVLAIAGLVYGLSLLYFILGWVVCGVVADAALFAVAAHRLRREGHKGVFRRRLGRIGQVAPGIWRFLVSTNLNGTVRILSRELDTLLVAGVIGVAAAGIYKVAKQFASIIGRISDPVDHAIYPVLAQAWSARHLDGFRRVLAGATVTVASLGLALWALLLLFGAQLVHATVGAEYRGAFGIMLIYGIPVLIGVATGPLQPALVAMGKPEVSLQVIVLSTIVYFAALFALLPFWGVRGAAFAYLGYYILSAPLMTRSVQRQLRLAANVSSGESGIVSDAASMGLAAGSFRHDAG